MTTTVPPSPHAATSEPAPSGAPHTANMSSGAAFASSPWFSFILGGVQMYATLHPDKLSPYKTPLLALRDTISAAFPGE